MFEIVLIRSEPLFKKSVNIKNLNELYSPCDKTEELPPFKLHKNILNHLSKGTKIFVPYNNGEDFIYQYTNEKWFAELSIDYSEFIGKRFKHIFPQLANLGIFNLLKEVYLKGNEIKFNLEVYEDNILTNSFQYNLFNENNLIFSVVEDTTEISLLNPAERQIYNSTIQGILELKYDGEIIRFNKTAQKITGYSINDLNLQNLNDYILEINNFNSEIKTMDDALEKLANDELLFSDSELKIKAKDGSEKWIKTHSNKLKLHKNIIQTSFIDISSMKKAENEELILRENLEISQKIFKFGNFFINKTNEFFYTQGIYDILEKEKCVDDKYTDLILNALVPEDKIKFLDISANINLENPNAIFEGKIETNNGKLKYIKYYIANIFEENGDKTVNCFIQDITNQKIDKNEAIKLKKALDVVGPKSKFAINWWSKYLNFESTAKLFDILEIEAPIGLKYSKDVLLDFIVPNDLFKFKEEYLKFINCENDEFDMNLEINTGKNNKKYIRVYKKAFNKENGKVISYVGYIQDITEKELLKKQESDYFDKSIQGLGIIKNNQFIKVNDKFTDILNIGEKKIIHQHLDFDDFSIEGITNADYLDLCNKIETKKLYFYDDILIKDQNQWIKFHLVPTDYMGESAILISIIDITEEILNEKELDKNKKEKELLLGEVHDRVKNNLQIIASLLRLEKRFDSKSSGKLSNDTLHRIETLALVHENAYESNELTQIFIKDFIQNQLSYLISFNYFNIQDINFTLDIGSNLLIPLEYMTHLSLITNEIFNNSLVYAFDEDNKNKEIYCNVSIEDKIVRIIIKDNGKGLPEGLNINAPKTLSFTIINLLTLQLEGRITNITCEGTGYYLEFPIKIY